LRTSGAQTSQLYRAIHAYLCFMLLYIDIDMEMDIDKDIDTV